MLKGISSYREIDNVHAIFPTMLNGQLAVAVR